jgi:hypothetical protein
MENPMSVRFEGVLAASVLTLAPVVLFCMTFVA